MITVAIELAENGVIKILHDDNINGAGEEFELRKVYDFEGANSQNSKITFLTELALDLGMDLGTELDESKIVITSKWGDKFTPNKDQAAKRIIIIPETATITRRFRTIYSSFVAFGGATALEVSPTASIPNEGYILDTINFSGGASYVSGVDASSNKALFINCVGITNSTVVGSYYVLNGAIATLTTLDTWAVGTASTTGILNSKFTHGGNRLTYTGVRSLTFKVTAVAVITWAGGGNNKDIGIGIVKNGVTTLVTSEMTTRAVTSGVEYFVSTQDVFSLATNDFVEVYVITRSATVTSITLVNLNVIVTEI